MYNFKVGERVKLKTFDMYCQCKLNPWCWLIIDEYVTDSIVHVHPEENPAITVGANLSDLELPFGYEDVYTICLTSSNEAKKVHSWLKTRDGISVWVCHDLSMPGRYNYTPAINHEGVPATPDMKPHWSMELIKIVTDPKRIKYEIEVVSETKPPDAKANWKYAKRDKVWYRVEPWEPE